VEPIGGSDRFSIFLEAANATVGEAKAGVDRLHGLPANRQDLHRVVVLPNGAVPREDDPAPEHMSDSQLLGDGEAVVLLVKDAPLVWRRVAAVMLAGETAFIFLLRRLNFPAEHTTGR
jgi:hypothetical protein